MDYDTVYLVLYYVRPGDSPRVYNRYDTLEEAVRKARGINGYVVETVR